MESLESSPKPPSAAAARDRRSLYLMIAMVVAAGVAVYALKGIDIVVASLQADFELLLYMIPRMAAAVILGGFVQAMVPKGMIARWLGEGAGFRGYALATIAGTCTPGGPMLSFPIVVGLRAAGAGYPALIAYVTAWATLGIHRIVTWEIPLFGEKFALARFAASLVFPTLVGFATQAILARCKQAL